MCESIVYQLLAVGPEKELPLLDVKRAVALSRIFRLSVQPTITAVSFPDPMGNQSKRTQEIFPADSIFPYILGNSQYLTKCGLKIQISDDRAGISLTKPAGSYPDIFKFVNQAPEFLFFWLPWNTKEILAQKILIYKTCLIFISPPFILFSFPSHKKFCQIQSQNQLDKTTTHRDGLKRDTSGAL